MRASSIFSAAACGWGADDFGIAYGHADGGKREVFQRDVAEGNDRFAVDDTLAVTADIQWINASYGDAEDIGGWLFGNQGRC